MSKICIDAGHGGKFNNATSYDGVPEKTENLTNALALEKEMRRRGHTVYMTRTVDRHLAPDLGDDLRARVKVANDNGVDCFISLHENGYADPDAHGAETIFGTNAGKKSIAWANDCLSRIVAATGMRRRTPVAQGITVMTRTKAPCILVEFGFMTNKNDMAIIRTRREKFITAIADSAEAFFGKGTGAEPEVRPEGGDYAYELKEGARLWRDAGEGKAGTDVVLDAYPTYEEPNGAYARVKDAAGDTYLVEWTKLKKR